MMNDNGDLPRPNRNGFAYRLGRLIAGLIAATALSIMAWVVVVAGLVLGRWAWDTSTLVMRWLEMP